MPPNNPWTTTTRQCLELQGDCSRCDIPALNLHQYRPVKDGHACHVWSRVQTLLGTHPFIEDTGIKLTPLRETLLALVRETPGLTTKELGTLIGKPNSAGSALDTMVAGGLMRKELVLLGKRWERRWYPA